MTINICLVLINKRLCEENSLGIIIGSSVWKNFYSYLTFTMKERRIELYITKRESFSYTCRFINILLLLNVYKWHIYTNNETDIAKQSVCSIKYTEIEEFLSVKKNNQKRHSIHRIFFIHFCCFWDDN